MTAFLMDRPVTADQVHNAARALGFTIDMLHPRSPGTGSDVDDPDAPLQDATILLAVLDAIILRRQIDQDLRDPLNQHTRHAVALLAQAVVSDNVGDQLAAAMRRMQTVSGLLSTPAETDGAAYPGIAAQALVNAATALVAAWITAYTLEEPPAGTQPSTRQTLDRQTLQTLADRADVQLAAASDALRAWRASGGIP